MRKRFGLFLKYVAAPCVVGAGAYSLHSYNSIVQPTNTVKGLQTKANMILLNSAYCQKRFGKSMVSMIPVNDLTELIEDLNSPEDQKISFNMKLKKQVEDLDYTAEVNVNFDRKVSHVFYILRKDEINLNSIEIKFKNSLQNKFTRLFDVVHLSKSAENNSVNSNYIFLVHSKSLVDSGKYLLEVMTKKEEQFLIKIVRSLIDDKDKLEYIGEPFKIVYSKRFKQDDKDVSLVRIEGKIRNAEIIIGLKDNTETAEIDKMNIMYEVDPDSQSSLTDLVQSAHKSNKLKEILSDVDLRGIINEKFIKSERKMKSIGEVVSITIDNDENEDSNGCLAVVKLRIEGKLNNASFILKFTRKSEKEKWNLEKSDLKILWNTKS